MEHGFVLGSDPDGDGAVRVRVGFGDATPVLVAADRVRIERGGETFWYRDARAWDAVGAPVPVRMFVRDRGVELDVDVRGAAWPVTVDPLLTEASTTLAGVAAGDALGRAVGPAGDVNGDGYADLLVGSSTWGGGRGRVWVHHGGAVGLDVTAATVITGAPAEGLGVALFTAGDVNADGYEDVVITSSTQVAVVRGSGAGLDTATRLLLPQGGAVSGARGVGDLNGDGFADVAIALCSAGQVVVHHGSAAGVEASPAAVITGVITAGARCQAVGAGDADHDGYADLVVADADAPGAGRLHLFRGGAVGVGAAPAQTITGPGASWGHPVEMIGDVNRDGNPDLAVVIVDVASATSTLQVLHGDGSGFEAAPAFTYSAPGEGPMAMCGAGDVDADGFADLAIGLGDVGEVRVFHGTAGGASLTAMEHRSGAAGSFGTSITWAGDVDLDGRTDLAVGSPNDAGGAGSAYLFLSVRDGDGDGVAAGLDCDDEDPSRYPGRSDFTGDGIDSDCDGQEVCYVDGDADGYRTLNGPTVVSSDGDCADPGEALGRAPATDCDDAQATVRPGADEVVADGVDQNCDTREICYRDFDGDGYRADPGSVVASVDLDCRDPGEAGADAPIGDCNDLAITAFPGAEEVVANAMDDDCDGRELCFADADNDNFRPDATATVESEDSDCTDNLEAVPTDAVGDCDDLAAAVRPTAMEVTADSVDQNCDGIELCWVDVDDDGFRPMGVARVNSTDLDCTDPGEALNTDPATDCDDARAGVNPSIGEVTGDGVDANCDGREVCFVDADNDGYRPNGVSTVISSDADCDDNQEARADEPIGDCRDALSQVHPGGTDLPNDMLDGDCDGFELCWADADGDGYRADGDAVVRSADLDCLDLGEAVATAPVGDCDDAVGAVYPGAAEVPGDGVDNNCDGGEQCLADLDADGYRSSTLTWIDSVDGDCDDPGEVNESTPTGDCDDEDPDVHPNAFESIADGIDENCDGREICYRDVDGDGYRPLGLPIVSSPDADCDDAGEADKWAGVGDCNDAVATAFPGADETVADGIDQDCDGRELCYVDLDGDGWRQDDTNLVESPDGDCSDAGEARGVLPVGDCEDMDADVHPGRAEVVADNVDADCDGREACYGDQDQDGYRTTDTVLVDYRGGVRCTDPGYDVGALPAGDCDDGRAAVHPGATELPADQLDADCDGRELCYLDADSDGFRPDETSTVESADADCVDPGEAAMDALLGDCDDAHAAASPVGVEIPGDELDGNCDGAELCFVDLDGDGYRDAAGTVIPSADLLCDVGNEARASSPAGDCDDEAPAIHPDAAEAIDNAIDEDCDGAELCFADLDDDGYRTDLVSTVGSEDMDCFDPGEAVAIDPIGDCDDLAATAFPGGVEQAADGIDGDCDGAESCYVDADDDGYRMIVATLVASEDGDCSDPGEAVLSDPASDCDDRYAFMNPGAVEIVGDGFDGDCSGVELCWLDLDGDGFHRDATATVESADGDCTDLFEGGEDNLTGDCDDGYAEVNPAAEEAVGDELDGDCDGAELCWADADRDGVRVEGAAPILSSDLDCEDPGEIYVAAPVGDCDDTNPNLSPFAPEIPGDGLDGDCDGYELCGVDFDDDGYLIDAIQTMASDDLDCADPGEGAASDPASDCDDNVAAVYPGAQEVAGDGLDGNCDGRELCLRDVDRDGAVPVSRTPTASTDLDCTDPGEAYASAPTDCDDADATLAPGRDDSQPGDNVDNDCDGFSLCYVDADNDGYRVSDTIEVAGPTRGACDGVGVAVSFAPTGDCDDQDGARSPAAQELPADGLDADCDARELCWTDADGDGFRSVATILSPDLDCADAGEVGTELPGPDCDDGDASVYPAAPNPPGDDVEQDCGVDIVCFVDEDRDGWHGGRRVLSVDPDCNDANEAWPADPGGDCDELNPEIHPSAFEVVGDGVDADCDARELCFHDVDGDGWAGDDTLLSSDLDCADAGEIAADGRLGDCDETRAAIHPATTELLNNGVDEDCDGGDSCPGDVDQDGWLGAAPVASADLDCLDPGEGLDAVPGDCDDLRADVNPTIADVPDDGVDADCVPEILCAIDIDGDGHLSPIGTVWSEDDDCTDPGEGNPAMPDDDCDDADPTRYPGAREIPGDGIDQSCAPPTRCEADDDFDGYAGERLMISIDRDCTDPGEATPGGFRDCDDADPSRHPAAHEVVGDRIDQNCDDADLCYLDSDEDGVRIDRTALVPLASGDCDQAGFAGPAAPSGDCDDFDALTYPGAFDVPGDRIDQDCNDGLICFADVDGDGWRSDVTVVSADVDCDDAGEASAATPSGDCDDRNVDVAPQQAEVAADGVDQDCDGADDCYVDADGDGYRLTSATRGGDDMDCDDAGEATLANAPGDCADRSAERYPGADEPVGGTVDLNCDGDVFCYQDFDQDGYRTEEVVSSDVGTCEAIGMALATDPEGDCNDFDAEVNPGSFEIPDDDLDNDCADGDEVTGAPDVTDEGCGGCDSGAPGATWLWGAAAALLVRRRQRAT